jgi:hypothetical protein
LSPRLLIAMALWISYRWAFQTVTRPYTGITLIVRTETSPPDSSSLLESMPGHASVWPLGLGPALYRLISVGILFRLKPWQGSATCIYDRADGSD